MDVNRLSAEELTYELDVRGLKGTTVDEMRKMLRTAIRREASFILPEYPFSFEEDKTAVTAKLDELFKLTGDFVGNEHSGEFKKIVAKAEWVLRRLGRSICDTAEDKAFVADARQQVVGILSNLDVKAAVDVGGAAAPVQGVQELNLHVDERFDAPVSPVTYSHPRAASSPLLPPTKKVPVMKWGLKFSGESGQSVTSFLEKVEELREARGFTTDEVYLSAYDLFEGKAAIWYRANKLRFRNWRGLLDSLRAEFLPPGYEERLWAEIRGRTQGQSETIGIYVSVMQCLFDRLSEQCSEETKLKQIRRNLSPFYQSQMALVEIKSLDHLVEVGHRLEATRYLVESFAPPPTRRMALLEPDLAYVGVPAHEEAPAIAATSFRAPTPLSCFRCKEPGHIAARCPQPVRCYGCNTAGVIRSRCPRCSPQTTAAGNGVGTQGQAGR